MTWIDTVPYEAASGRLRKIYDQIAGPDKNIDNIMLVHGLRPHSLEGHMALYKAVLHHHGNRLETWLLEALGVYVSLLNNCRYCVDHHSEGMRRQLKDDARAQEICRALEAGAPETALSGAALALMGYAEKLTLRAAELGEADIAALRLSGLDDGEILEANQVISYFNYANRTVLGLGVTTKGDDLGLSPSNSADPTDWSHR
jgi:uncharacterized peroxidase-related enzyme